MAAASNLPNLVSAVEVKVVGADGTVIARKSFSTRSPRRRVCLEDFEEAKVSFAVPPTASDVVVMFSDISPGGGVGVDLLLDGVRLRRD